MKRVRMMNCSVGCFFILHQWHNSDPAITKSAVFCMMGLLLVLAAIFAILFSTGVVFLGTWLIFRATGKTGWKRWALGISLIIAIVIVFSIFATFFASV